MSSFFEETEAKATRLKALVFGASGTGKTVMSASFPDPAIFDIEDGARHYGKYGKKLMRVVGTDLKKIQGALDELLANPQHYKTAVVDSFTKLYATILAFTEARLKAKTGNPNYELQPLDYKPINALTKNILNKFLALDMNLIVTAWPKIKWAKGEFMKEEGVIPDVPTYVPFEFDVILELFKREDYYKDEPVTTDLDKKFVAVVHKDRTNTLPPVFDYTYSEFVKFMGIEELEREPLLINQINKKESNSGRTLSIIYDGEEIKTAGITADQLGQISSLVEAGDAEAIQQELKDVYYSESFLDLKEDEAISFIDKIKNMDDE